MNNRKERLTEITGTAETFPAGTKTFAEVGVQTAIGLLPWESGISDILRAAVEIETGKNNLIRSVEGVSPEGQVQTGKKLAVEGGIHIRVEYASEDSSHPTRLLDRVIPFLAHIVLDKSTAEENGFEVKAYIEDTLIRQLDSRNFYFNILFLLAAAQMPIL